MSENKLRTRYLSSKHFEDADQDMFFGRDVDILNLSNLIRLEKLVVLYGKSGLGKSSLMGAGVIPFLKKELKRESKVLSLKNDKESPYQAVRIRFFNNTDKKYTSLVALTKNEIEKEREKNNLSSINNDLANILDALIPSDQSLWKYLKDNIQAKDERPLLLFFDQFEELFSHPAQAIAEFKQALSEVLASAIPERFLEVWQEQYDSFSEAQNTFLEKPLEVKVVFTIRNDKMDSLKDLADKLPAIFKAWYELKPLAVQEAKEAITYPAQKIGNFSSAPFSYQSEALAQIIGFLTKNNTAIESTQLQILCNRLESEMVKKQKSQHPISEWQISLSDIPDFEDIFLEFYHETIEKLPEAERGKARLFIENQLIIKGQRISLDRLVCLDFLPESTINALVSEHLLRGERNSTGGTSYELSHDTLIAPISEAKRVREEEEQRQAEERKAQAEAEAERQRIEKDRIEKEKQLKRQRTIISIVSVAAVISLLLAGWAFFAQQEASRQTKLAIEATQKALKQEEIAKVNAQKALLSAKEAEKERNESDSLAKIAKQQEENATKQTQIAQGALAQAQQEKQKALSLLDQIALAEATSAETAINQFEFGKALQHIRNASISQDKEVILKVKTRLADYLVIGIYKYPPQEWSKMLLPYASAFRKIGNEVQVNFEKKGDAILMADFEKAQREMSVVRGTRTTAIRSELIKAMTQKLGKEVMQPALRKNFNFTVK